jgi:thiosulfate dehydrogenase
MLKKILALLALVFAILFLALIYVPDLTDKKQEEKQALIQENYSHSVIDGIDYHFELVDPTMAPPEKNEAVMYGYNLIQFTNKFLPEYVGDRLTCNNCHFAGGNTLGGKNGGISLLGVTNTYPKYYEREKKVIDLADRINNCFQRSMNGRIIAKNSKEMQAMISYLDWISSNVPKNEKHYPWLGLQMLKTKHTPDPIAGEKVYVKHCAICHQFSGNGDQHNPPVWGKAAFNDGAGMAEQSKMASFIFYNMPYHDPFLTEEESADVAAYILKQDRPKFNP